MNGNSIFFIEWDEIDWEQYFSKIPFHSFELEGIGQELNLAHAWYIEYLQHFAHFNPCHARWMRFLATFIMTLNRIWR
jgi:hypothetical protein